jgi:NhaP-type Na+/H+ or K+/H+ antiporter
MGLSGVHTNAPTPAGGTSSDFAGEFSIVIFLALLLGMVCISILLLPFDVEQTGRLASLVVGAGVGAVLSYGGTSGHISGGSILSFSDDLFFYVLVPPVVFAEAFCMRKRRFFGHLGTVVSMGVLGCFVQAALIGLALFYLAKAGVHDELDVINPTEALLLGAALASSEGAGLVDAAAFPRTRSLMHGEGVLNDPASIVAFTALLRAARAGDDHRFGVHELGRLSSEFCRISFFSVLIGLGASVLCARAVRAAGRAAGRRPGMSAAAVQIALAALFSWEAYMLSEALQLSGTLTLFVAALVLAQLAFPAMEPAAQLATTHIFHTLSFMVDLFLVTWHRGARPLASTAVHAWLTRPPPPPPPAAPPPF